MRSSYSKIKFFGIRVENRKIKKNHYKSLLNIFLDTLFKYITISC